MATESVSEAPALFLRNATGLVRGWNVRDSIIYACLATNFVTLAIYEFAFAAPATEQRIEERHKRNPAQEEKIGLGEHDDLQPAGEEGQHPSSCWNSKHWRNFNKNTAVGIWLLALGSRPYVRRVKALAVMRVEGYNSPHVRTHERAGPCVGSPVFCGDGGLSAGDCDQRG